MSRNEQSSKRLASLASKVLSGDKRPTAKEAKSLAAAVLTQAPDRRR